MRGHDDENGAPGEGIGNCLPLSSVGEQIAGNQGQIVKSCSAEGYWRLQKPVLVLHRRTTAF